jgi:hypothetical protein
MAQLGQTAIIFNEQIVNCGRVTWPISRKIAS